MAYLFLIGAALFWSGNFVLSRGINNIIPPVSLGFWRWVLAGVILLPFSYKYLIRDCEIIKSNFRYLNLLAFLGVTCFNPLIYVAVHYTTAINAVLVNSFVPILILVISLFMYKEAPHLNQIFGIIFSMVGITVIMLKGDLNSIYSFKFNIGDILVFLAAFTWALYTVLLKKLPKDIHPIAFLQIIIFLGLLYMFPFYILEYITKGGFVLEVKTALSILYVALFASVFAFIMWNRAVKEIGANRAGPFVHLMPVFGTILAIVFLGEKLYIYHIVGIFLVFVGIFLANKVPGK
ncbi:MAG: DMT family transporter [Calditerrivibrio sp.]|nr:DMT family transporter [Calditerrivibrio sp.]